MLAGGVLRGLLVLVVMVGPAALVGTRQTRIFSAALAVTGVMRAHMAMGVRVVRAAMVRAELLVSPGKAPVIVAQPVVSGGWVVRAARAGWAVRSPAMVARVGLGG
jgi:hypothetical protein